LLEPNVSATIFPVRVSLSRVMVDVSKRVRLGTEQRMGRSQQVVSCPLESGRDVRIKTCVSGKGIFPKSRALSEEKVLRAKGQGKVLNISHVGRCNDHHQLIMKLERMKNHDAHIMYTLQLLSVVLYMPRSVPITRMCCKNIRLASKPPATMDSLSLGTIPSLACPVINVGYSACILFNNQVYALSVILPSSLEFLIAGNSIAIICVTSPGQSRLPPWVHAKSIACRKNTHCTMETSQNMRKGVRSGRNVGPEPQSLTSVNEDLNVSASFE
jgi:hypothetical protein